jgi:hypothetical protein
MERSSNGISESTQQGFLHERARRLGRLVICVVLQGSGKRHLEAASACLNGLVVEWDNSAGTGPRINSFFQGCPSLFGLPVRPINQYFERVMLHNRFLANIS